MKYLFLITLLALFTSCGGSEESETDGKKNNFHMEGQVKGAANQEVKIVGSTDRGQFTLAETKTDASGNFELDSYVPGLGIYTLQIGKDQRNAVVIPVDVDDDVQLKADMETFSYKPTFSGPEWAKPLNQYMALFSTFAERQMIELPKITDQAQQLAAFREMRKPLDQLVRKTVINDPGNPVNLVFTSILFPANELGYQNYDPSNIELLKRMSAAYHKEHADSPMTNMLDAQIAKIEAQYNEYQKYVSGSFAAPEIVAQTPDGTELRLSSLRGKVVLVDFWASWCQPCRQENPNLVKIYKQLHSQGLEILSFSLDKDKSAWKAAIEKDGLLWKTHVSDLLGWETPMVSAYNFQGIPYSVIVNRDGKIVAAGLRGSELEQKLVEVLRQK